MKTLLFFALALISTPSLSSENSCEAFDLRDNQGSMSEVIISQQDENMGTCYANAISMANDAWTYSHKKDEVANSNQILRTSYLALASEFGMSEKRDFSSGSQKNGRLYFESGGIDSLLNLMLVKREYCTTKNGKSLLEEITDQKMYKDLVALGNIYQTYSKSFDNGSNLLTDLEKKEDFKEIVKKLTDSNREKLYSILKAVASEDKKVGGQDFIHRVIVNSCEKLEELKWHKYRSFAFEDVLSHTHRTNLKKGFINHFSKKENAQPLIISFCKTAVQERSKSLDSMIESSAPVPSDEVFSKYCGAHASLIVARKEVAGNCKLVIRDNMNCDDESAKKMNATCDGPDFAIDQDYFNSFIMSINVITE